MSGVFAGWLARGLAVAVAVAALLLFAVLAGARVGGTAGRSPDQLVIIDKNIEHWGRFETPRWEQWFGREELEKLLRRHCRQVSSEFISYWEDVAPDGLFAAWKATK